MDRRQRLIMTAKAIAIAVVTFCLVVILYLARGSLGPFSLALGIAAVAAGAAILAAPRIFPRDHKRALWHSDA
jgi:hypothetical protein